REPAGPDAWTGTERDEPSARVTSSIGVIASDGALATRMCVTAEPNWPVMDIAVNRMSYSPASPELGVQLNVPDVFEPFGVKVAPTGRIEVNKASTASPSA